MPPEPKRRQSSTKLVNKKKSARRRSYRDLPAAPTAKEIEQSIKGGSTESLRKFVTSVKL